MFNFIVCDLEYTLLREDKTVSEETIDRIIELKANGVNFAVATGRDYNSVKDLLGAAKNDVVYICNDGGSIIFQDKVISKTPIDRLSCSQIVSEMEEDSRYGVVIGTETESIICSKNYEFTKHLDSLGIVYEKVKDFREVRGDITKITLFAKNGLDELSYSQMHEKWAEKATVGITDVEQAYVTALGVNKGSALGLVQQLFGISKEDTVVFGGGYSDIEMFDYSFFSYGMQNADSQVREAAKHITENVDIIMDDILLLIKNS